MVEDIGNLSRAISEGAEKSEPREPAAREAVAKQFREFQQSRAKIGINYDDVVDFALAYSAELLTERDIAKQALFDKYKNGEIVELLLTRPAQLRKLHDTTARAEAAESSLLQARTERDDALEQRDAFLRDGKRPLDVLAREIVETLRPTDKPGSSEYNVVWVGSKLKTIVAAALASTSAPEGTV
ncbi:MAG TPA: hypothetical protein VGP89_18110 [Candidatus Angelobacter sp.]|jgi:hypothetical protein|nr:hypothetical protein [Candidatus Angelobacter sp.]